MSGSTASEIFPNLPKNTEGVNEIISRLLAGQIPFRGYAADAADQFLEKVPTNSKPFTLTLAKIHKRVSLTEVVMTAQMEYRDNHPGAPDADIDRHIRMLTGILLRSMPKSHVLQS